VEVAWPDALPVPLPPRGAPAPRLLRLLPAEYQNEPVGSENQIVQPTQIHDFTMEGFIGPDGQPDTYLKGANGVIVKLSECVEYLATPRRSRRRAPPTTSRSR
jgi:hypothetical protein